MAGLDIQQSQGTYAVMLTPHDRYWAWAVYDLQGEPRAHGQDTDREAAWRSGLFAAGADLAGRQIDRKSVV